MRRRIRRRWLIAVGVGRWCVERACSWRGLPGGRSRSASLVEHSSGRGRREVRPGASPRGRARSAGSCAHQVRTVLGVISLSERVPRFGRR